MPVATDTTPERHGLSRLITWLVGRWWFWALAVAILFAQPLVRTFMRPAPSAPPMGAGLPAFHLLREDGGAFDPSTVSGRVWVASFVKPGAPDADAVLEATFQLQHRLRNMGDAVRLVTLPSDDSTPSPLVMAGLGHAHHHNARVWLLVTGDGMELARLRAAFGAPSGPTDKRFWLVDSRGHLRGAYDSTRLDPLVEDLSVLVNAQ